MLRKILLETLTALLIKWSLLKMLSLHVVHKFYISWPSFQEELASLPVLLLLVIQKTKNWTWLHLKMNIALSLDAIFNFWKNF
jgi:hypothetical protein